MTSHSSATVFLAAQRAQQLCVAALLAGLLLAGAPGELRAAEPAAEPPASSTAGGSAEAKSNTDDTSSAEVFIPTEEISEDFAVSFPVDI